MEDDQCNQLDFQLGGTVIDAIPSQIPGNRQWNIKVYIHTYIYILYIYIYIYNSKVDCRQRIFSLVAIVFQITQIECNSDLRAPQGCTQYFYGSNSQEARSYNFDNGNGLHLGKSNLLSKGQNNF